VGDIWLPGYPPRYTSFLGCLAVTGTLWPTRADAIIMAAVGGSEGGYDMAVINDTPSTGDYSVGVWQINYYNGLYQERAAEFGTPEHLIAGGVGRQADAAFRIWQQQGFGAWTSYTSGAWRRFLPGGAGVPGPQGPQGQINPAPPAPAKDWSTYVRLAAGSAKDATALAVAYGNAIRRI
jgi:hypothetical protein